jgi:hypothetical protein
VKQLTPKQFRKKVRMEQDLILHQQRLDRLEAARLIFVEGRGRIGNLTRKQINFIRMVEHTSYDAYVESVRTGKPKRYYNPTGGHVMHRIPATTIGTHLNFRKWWRRWFICLKGNWVRWQVPKIARARLEQALANSNTTMQEQ